MKIRFDDVEYTMAYAQVNVMPTHFQVSVLKGESTIDSIVENVQGCDEITVIDDDNNVAGIYRGYKQINAITTYDGNIVSVELLNTDLEAQINALANSLSQVQEVQTTQESAITDLGEATNALSEANDTQDLAIEDLAEVVDSLIPEEE